MAEALEIAKMIALSAEASVEGAVVRDWYQTVKTLAPSGSLLTLPGIDDGTPKRVSMVHREIEGRHSYVIPLSRDLTDDEIGLIVDEFSSKHPDFDFDIEASALSIEAARVTATEPQATVDRERYHELCSAWAKRQHETWVKDRVQNGWRCGVAFSPSAKVHPLLKPWDQLPDEYRTIDVEQPQMLLDLLNQQGYAVITKAELESLLSLMR